LLNSEAVEAEEDGKRSWNAEKIELKTVESIARQLSNQESLISLVFTIPPELLSDLT
jgi:hypothetical protein